MTTSERAMLLIGYWIGMLVTLLLAALVRGQSAPDIVRPFDGFTVRTTWPADTSYVTCWTPGMPESPVATLSQAESVAGKVLSIPGILVRCSACNTAGCSDLSPNAYDLRPRNRADCNGDGATNVSDITCYVRVIYGGAP